MVCIFVVVVAIVPISKELVLRSAAAAVARTQFAWLVRSLTLSLQMDFNRNNGHVIIFLFVIFLSDNYKKSRLCPFVSLILPCIASTRHTHRILAYAERIEKKAARKSTCKADLLLFIPENPAITASRYDN